MIMALWKSKGIFRQMDGASATLCSNYNSPVVDDAIKCNRCEGLFNSKSLCLELCEYELDMA